MIAVLAIVFAVQATAVFAGGARYPSGLNPALCPNYPHCDNVLLAAYAQPGANEHYSEHYSNNNNGAQQYGSGYQHHPSGGAYGHHQQPAVPLPYTEPGYPAGLSSSNCPNYPYCSHQVPAEAFKYEAAAHKRYPAGVTPHNCPNYPYCY